MNKANQNVYSSGDVRIVESLGTLESPDNSVALSLVNMKVAGYLLKHQGQVISRNVLIEAVWPNQEISDDALTRAISDIRAALSQISQHKHIQTLPKRGYRWNFVEADNPTTGLEATEEPTTEALVLKSMEGNSKQSAGNVNDEEAANELSLLDTRENMSNVDALRRPVDKTRLKLKYIGVFSVVLTLTTLIGASLIVWSAKQFDSAPTTRVALLPVQTHDESLNLLAYEFRSKLKKALMNTSKISILSDTATRAELAKPFPHYNRQFGIHRVIETQFRRQGNDLIIHCQYADARSAEVLGIIEKKIALRSNHQIYGIKAIVYELMKKNGLFLRKY